MKTVHRTVDGGMKGNAASQQYITYISLLWDCEFMFYVWKKLYAVCDFYCIIFPPFLNSESSLLLFFIHFSQFKVKIAYTYVTSGWWCRGLSCLSPRDFIHLMKWKRSQKYWTEYTRKKDEEFKKKMLYNAHGVYLMHYVLVHQLMRSVHVHQLSFE